MNQVIDQKQDLLTRLRRAEGQVRGIHRMVESDGTCIDVLTQVSATTNALESVALTLLEEHLRRCVSEANQHAGIVSKESLDEVGAVIVRLVRP